MSMLSFLEWLGATPYSVALHESIWTYPIVETVHVLGVSLFGGFALLLDLRLLGLTMKRVPVSQVADRLLPWTVFGFVLLVLSGITLFYADPVRFYTNIFFRIKAVMLVLAGLNVFAFHSGIWLSVKKWDLTQKTPTGARIAAYVSITLWGCIVTAGRMIAYNWFDR